MGNKVIAIRYSKQLARHRWDIVNPGLNKLEKEVVIPKEFKHLRRQYVAIGPQGRCYV